MDGLLPILLVAAGVALAVVSWPVALRELRARFGGGGGGRGGGGRRGAGGGSAAGARASTGPGAAAAADRDGVPVDLRTDPALASVLGDGPQLDEDCRPLVPGVAGAELSEYQGLSEFLARVERRLSQKEPGWWPDKDRAGRCLEDARTSLDEAEQTAERLCGRVPGGAAAAGAVDRAMVLLSEAEHRGAQREDSRAEIARGVWVRSRSRQQHYWRDGVVTAARYANDALQAHPRHKDAKTLRARAQVALGRLDAARHALIALMSEFPDDGEILRSRSRWLRAHGDLRGAADAVLDALWRMREGVAMAERLRVGPMLIQQGRARDAAEVYEELAKWRQDLPEVWAGGARCLLEQRRWQEAADSARKSIEIEGTAEARELLREAMVKLGKGEPNA